MPQQAHPDRRRHRRRAAGVVRLAGAAAVALAACGAPAQVAAPPPDAPSPAHEALSFFEGAWTTTDATTADPFQETCGWLAGGRRHMVCRSRWADGGRPREGLSIFSIDATSGDVLYHGFRAGGAAVLMRGRPAGAPGRGWRFEAERGDGAARVRTRVTI
ncbi:MAG: hypothetical protein ABI696_16300, partial [Rubrivivax sp.]